MAGLQAFKKGLELAPFSVTKEFVRYARKPMWMPTAKSKLFRVPQKPVLPTDEREEITRLVKNYRTSMKSVRMFLATEQDKIVAASSIGEDAVRHQEDDHLAALEYNRQENARLAAARDDRFIRQMDEQRQRTLEAKQRFLAQKESRIKEYTQMIEELERQRTLEAKQRFLAQSRIKEYTQMIEELEDLSKTLITAETLEKAIEEALANPVDPNYALDKDGNKYIGTTGFDVKVPVGQITELEAMNS